MRRIWRDVGAVLAIALLTGALLVFALLYQREAALRSGSELTDSLSRVISEQTARTLQSVDQALQLAIVRLESARAHGGLDEATGREFLRAHLKDLPFLRSLWVVDRDGRILYNSDEGTVGADMRDRPYFQAFLREPHTEFYIGPLVRSRTRGTWMLSVARPIRDAKGQVVQVVAGAVEPPYFEQLWRGIDLGANGAIGLYSRRGQLLARSPADPAALGKDFSHLPIFREHLPQAPQGTFIRESGFDGVLRVFAYRQLPTYPEVVVAVGTSYGEMLASWRRFATLTTTVWSVAVLVAIVLTVQLRRQARSREHTEQRFQQLAQAMPQIVFIAPPNGGVQFINQRWVESTGYPVEDALGIGWRQLVHPADMPALAEHLQEALRRKVEAQHEFRLLYRDGTYRWQLLRAVPVRLGSDTVEVWFGTATDIDALKQAQEQLRQQAERLHMASRLTRMGHYRADLGSQRVTLSEEAAGILDLPPDAEPSLQEIFAMFSPESLPRAVRAVEACVNDATPFDVEVELVTGARRHVWLRSVAEPVRDASGKVVAIQGAQQDITLRVLMMEEIRRLNAGLEERIAERTADLVANQEELRLANKQLEAFSYSVSHDLQSPLQRVSSFARLLQQELAAVPEGRAHHYLARIQANADEMAQLIEGLLALAHVSEVDLIRAPVNLSDIAAESLQRMQSEHPQRRVRWCVQPGLVALADVRLMRSVMENLLSNAWKFSAPAAEAEIEVGAGQEPGEFYVRDNGCGFDMAYADRLFGTFQRLHAADEFPGTGIGLATVARAISRQGGKVWAQATPGQGATFWFTLPPA